MDAVFIAPRSGKTQPIKVREDTHCRLKEGAKARGLTIMDYADQMLGNSMDLQDEMLERSQENSVPA